MFPQVFDTGYALAAYAGLALCVVVGIAAIVALLRGL